MLRNREFRRFAVLFALMSAAAVTAGFAISPAAAVLAAAIAVAFGAAFFVFTRNRYKRIARLSGQIDRVLHNADYLSFEEAEEGELSILNSEISKMTLRIREQNQELRREKSNLAASLADIAHQLRTPLTSAGLILPLLADSPDPDHLGGGVHAVYLRLLHCENRHKGEAESATEIDYLQLSDCRALCSGLPFLLHLCKKLL